MKKNCLKLFLLWKKCKKLCLIMRLSVVLILLGMFNVSASINAQQTRVNLQLKSTTLNKVLWKLEEKADVVFFYSSEDKVSEIVLPDLNFKNEAISSIISYCLKNTDLAYKFEHNVVVIAKKNVVDQQKGITIKGKVTDNKKNPLPGVSIVVKGTNLGVATDVKGEYKIDIPKSKDVVLVFSFMGMKKQEIAVGKKTKIDVVLLDEAVKMDEVVVTGAFERKASSFTGSTVTIKKEELLKVSNQNIFQALKNIDASLVIFDNLDFGSDPNKMPDMQLRGRSTFPTSGEGVDLKGNFRDNPNMPLFVLDGFAVSAEKIFDLDMNRVESVNILKDASAKAIWGSRAANGVVVVETKKSGSNNLRITYSNSSEISVPDLSKFDLCNAEEKLQLEYDAGLYEDEYERMIQTDKLRQEYFTKKAVVLSGVDTDWLSKPLRVAIGSKHSLSMEVGDDKLRLVADVSYRTTEGVMKGSNRNNLSFAINLSYRYKKLKFRNSLSINSNNSADSPYGSFSEYTRLNPYWSPYDEMGNIVKNVVVGLGDPYDYKENPLYNSTLNTKFEKEYTEITNNFSVEYNLCEGLRTKVKVGYSKKLSSADEFYPANHLKFRNYSGEDYFRRGLYNYNDGWGTRMTADYSLHFNKEILPKHYVFAFMSFNTSERKYQENIFSAEGFPSDRMNNIIFAKQYAKDGKPNGREETSREVGVSSSFNYTYDERFLLDGTYRMSASSEFGEKQRWGNFWSVGLGWNIHNEPFLKDSFIKKCKVRTSYGTTGSQGNAAYASIARYKFVTNKMYMGALGANLFSMKNQDLKWQQKVDFNVGLELNLNNKLDLVFEYYVANTENTLIDFSLPPSLGFATVKRNVGEVKNSGLELNMRSTLFSIPSERTYVSVNLRAAHNKNKLVKISDALSAYNAKMDKDLSDAHGDDAQKPLLKYYDGVSMDAIWAVRSLGIDPANGQEIYLDKDGNRTYIYNVNDQVVCGDKLPDVQGNFGLSVERKGFSLNAVFRYMYGAEMYNRTLVDNVENADLDYNVDRRLINGRWKEPGHNAPYKKLRKSWNLDGTEYGYEKTRPTSRFVQKRNELSLSSVNLSYNWYKDSFIKKMKLDRLKLSVYMNDVFMMSSIKVERGTQYPFARTINFAVQATF